MEIAAYAVALLLFTVVMLLRRSKIRRGGFDAVLEKLIKAGYTFDRQAGHPHGRFLLLADSAKRRWILLEEGRQNPARPADFSTLLGYSVWEDHRLTRSGGAGFEQEETLTGRALVRFSQKTCTHMEVRLRLSSDRPYVTLPLLDGETQKTSLTYENAKSAAREIATFLEEILQKGQNKEDTSPL